MRRKMEAPKPSTGKIIKNIRRIIGKWYGAEEKIRIVLEGGEDFLDGRVRVPLTKLEGRIKLRAAVTIRKEEKSVPVMAPREPPRDCRSHNLHYGI